MRNNILMLAFSVAFSTFAGCGVELPQGMPKLHPCTITVAMNGKPIDKALVRLVKDRLTWACTGITDAYGAATMVTDGKYPGIPEGKYKVLITKIETEEREYKGFVEESKLPPKKKTVVVDLKYGNPEKAAFEIDVADKENELTCEVTPPANSDLPKDHGIPVKKPE